MSPRSWILRAQDVVKAIDSALQIVSIQSELEFCEDEKSVLAVMACLNIIGEAVNHIPNEVKIKYSEIKWSQIRGMRNRISHEYFSLDNPIIYRTCTEALPVLKKQIIKILDNQNKHEN